MEVVKTRIAVSQTHEFHGVCDCIRRTIRQRGPFDLYRGMCANAVGIVPHRGIEMGLFFTLEQTMLTAGYGRSSNNARSDSDRPMHLPVTALVAIGLIASTVAQVATYPLNLARTRLQTQGVNGRPVLYTGLLDCLRRVYGERGWMGMFAGIAPNMCKAVPSSVIMFVSFREAQAVLASQSSDRRAATTTTSNRS